MDKSLDKIIMRELFKEISEECIKKKAKYSMKRGNKKYCLHNEEGFSCPYLNPQQKMRGFFGYYSGCKYKR